MRGVAMKLQLANRSIGTAQRIDPWPATIPRALSRHSSGRLRPARFQEATQEAANLFGATDSEARAGG